MITLVKTNSENPDFIDLVQLLDADLRIRDGEDHEFYAQFNKIGMIKYCLVAYENDTPVGCGAIKQYDENTMEVKRMWVSPEFRGRGISVQVLSELEKWASELSFAKAILETGTMQPEAISLYKKCGYRIIPNYGQYIGVDNSLCFEKELS